MNFEAAVAVEVFNQTWKLCWGSVCLRHPSTGKKMLSGVILVDVFVSVCARVEYRSTYFVGMPGAGISMSG